MRITHVETFSADVAAPEPPFRWRDGLRGSSGGQVGILRIGTDTGATGVATAHKPGSAVVLRELVDRVLRPELVGVDPLQREWLWERLWNVDRTEYLPIHLLGVIDTALWDLAGRVHGARAGNCSAATARASRRTRRP